MTVNSMPRTERSLRQAMKVMAVMLVIIGITIPFVSESHDPLAAASIVSALLFLTATKRNLPQKEVMETSGDIWNRIASYLHEHQFVCVLLMLVFAAVVLRIMWFAITGS